MSSGPRPAFSPEAPPDVAVERASQGLGLEHADAEPGADPLGGSHDRDRGPGQVAGALGRGDHHGRGAVVLRTAVEQVEGLHDPARLVVGLARQRAAVADRPGIALGVGVAGQRDVAQRFLANVVVVHEAPRLHRALGRRVEQAVGGGPGHRRRQPPAPSGAPGAEAPELPLRDRTEHHHVARVTRAHCGVRHLHGGSDVVAAARERLAGEAQLVDPQGLRQTQRRVALVHVGDEAVDLGQLQTGVLDRVADGDAGELELAVRRAPALVVLRFADAHDHRFSVHRASLRRNARRFKPAGKAC